MSDLRLRELERRWQETDSQEDGRAYLQALTRAGAPAARLLQVRAQLQDLSIERLELCAFLGHHPARQALGGVERLLLNTAEAAEVFGIEETTLRGWRRKGCPVRKQGRRLEFDPWEILSWRVARPRWIEEHHRLVEIRIKGCRFYDEQAGWRAALAVVRMSVDDTPPVLEALRAVETWVVQPSDAGIEVMRRAASPEADELRGHPILMLASALVRTHERATCDLGDLEREYFWVPSGAVRAHAIRNAVDQVCVAGNVVLGTRLWGTFDDPFGAVDQALQREVVPWALGERDPLQQ